MWLTSLEEAKQESSSNRKPILLLKNRDNKQFRETMGTIMLRFPRSLEAKMYFWDK